MFCPYCHQEHPDRARFCPVTGKTLELPTSPSIACPNCGNSIPPDAEFCPNCGATIAGTAGAVPPPESPADLSVACPNCGKSIPPDAEFCPNCGTVIAGGTGAGWAAFPLGKYIQQHVRLIAGIAVVILMAVLLIIFLPGLLSRPATRQSSSSMPTRVSISRPTQDSLSPQGNADPAPVQGLLLPTATEHPTIAIPPTDTPAQPEPTRVTCPGAPPIRVERRDSARVTSSCGDHILMRLNPVVATNAEQYLYPGDTINILDGPQCSNDVAFFLVEAPKYGKTGWVAEAEPESDSKNYCIEPVP